MGRIGEGDVCPSESRQGTELPKAQYLSPHLPMLKDKGRLSLASPVSPQNPEMGKQVSGGMF